MPRFVVLLRGVNVGKAKRVAMADFRAQLADLGYSKVTTLLNSGNAVFHAKSASAAKHAEAIATMLKRELDFDVPVIVKSAVELETIIAENPFDVDDTDHSRFFAIFSATTEALADLTAITPLVVPPEKFALKAHAAYLHCANGILESKAGKALLGKVGKQVTTRNWATTLKLQALARSDD